MKTSVKSQETGGLCPDLRKPAAGCAHIIKALKGPRKPDVLCGWVGGGGREENGECVVSLDATYREVSW